MTGYFAVYSPATYDLMDLDSERCTSVFDIISYLSCRDASRLDGSNYLDYLRFDPSKRRHGIMETSGIENGAIGYVGSQVAKLAPDARVIEVDDVRRRLPDVVESEGAKPIAVFITSISSDFPTAVAAAVALNTAGIPVVLGGIHVSTTPHDVDVFIRSVCPAPELVALVRGPGDSKVLGEIMADLAQGTLRSVYEGHTTVEDGVWRKPPNLTSLPPMCMDLRHSVPFVGRFLQNRVRIATLAPYLGCPYSCSFCSVSTVPIEQRRFVARSPRDFLEEVAAYHEADDRVPYTLFMFSTDNLMLGGEILDEILDGIIERELKAPFMGQISIDVANNEKLMEKMRRAGAVTFEFGLESLDMRNLEYINKNCCLDIEQSGLSVSEYYASQIRKVQSLGIGVQGSFMFGLPFDWFESLEANTGVEVGEFCTANHISLMPHCFGALPGARVFDECVQAGTLLYGKPGTVDYLRTLCVADHGEMNMEPPDALRRSPLLVAVMALEALRRAGSRGAALRSALYMLRKSFAFPTARGRRSLRDRVEDSILSGITELIAASLYRDVAERLAAPREGFRGGLQRGFDVERDPGVKEMLRDYVAQF